MAIETFRDFCGGTDIWNNTQLESGSWPEFTYCFQQTILIWIPCGWLLLAFPLSVLSKTTSYEKITVSFLSIAKLVLCMVLIAIVAIELIEELLSPEPPPTVFVVSSSLKILSFAIAGFLTQYLRIKGVHSSWVLTIFWILLTFGGIIPAYSKVYLEEYSNETFRFTIFYIYYIFVLVELVLHVFSESEETDQNVCPETLASVFNKMYFWWMNGLMTKAYKRILQEGDVWSLRDQDRSSFLSSRFRREWYKVWDKTYNRSNIHSSKGLLNGPSSSSKALHNSEKTPLLESQHVDKHPVKFTPEKKAQQNNVPLLNVLFRTDGPTLLKGFAVKAISDALQFISPMLLGVIIDYANRKDEWPTWRGYMPVIAMFCCTMVQSLCYQHNYQISFTVGLRIKSALISAIYRKALTMSNEMRKGATLGETVNLMAVDCQRIQDAFGFLWTFMTVPLQLTIGLYLLWGIVGPSCLAGLAVLLMLMPLNAVLAQKQRTLQGQILKYKGQRTKLLSEIFNGIKVLKMYAWELSFQEKVLDIRREELKRLRINAFLTGGLTLCWLLAPFVVTLATFTSYVFTNENHTITPSEAFVALSLFNIFRVPINLLSTLISFIVQAWVSLKRIQEFLSGTDLDPDNVQSITEGDIAVEINNGTFIWDKEMPKATLRDINVQVGEGQLVAIVGQVGCGKSSVVSAMLGDMNKLRGNVRVKGRLAYVPQEAWIQNATLQDNILFGKPMKKTKYQKIIDACALTADLDMLPGRDQIEIGEKGINVSGGQKQRISLARAVYSNSDIYLMDDPLSAVDSHVGKHIFEKVVGEKGLLKNKTRILVTHGIHWLPMVDNILVMIDGRVSEVGSYEQLISHNGPFAQFLKQYFIDEEETNNDEDPELKQIRDKIFGEVESVTSDNATSADELMMLSGEVQSRLGSSLRKRRITDEKELSSKPGEFSKHRLTQTEMSESGNLKLSIIKAYISAFGVVSMAIVLTLFCLYHTTSVFSNYWLTFWTEDPFLTNMSNVHTQEYIDTSNNYLMIYGLLGVVQISMLLGYGFLLSVKMVHAAGLLHNSMVVNMMRCPMSFFDTTPVGRIINRFSSDVDIMDLRLPMTVRVTLNTLFLTFTTFVVISVNTPIFLVMIVPLLIVYLLIMRFYIPTSRQLRRLESVTRSPVFNHFSETITGASVIRAFGVVDRFITESMTKVDNNQMYYFANISSARWLGVRIELLGNCLILSAAMFGIFSPLNGAVVGLSITYALQATSVLNVLVLSLTDVQNNLVSVERVREYTSVPSEAELRSQKRPPKNWPKSGKINYVNYQTRYRPGLDLVLKGINVTIEHNEKIGVVGRTGAGKSSMTLSLFRLIEAAGGSIVIDGICISDIGLHDLREKITILPQDPVLFSGPLRMNLDPFNKYTDGEIWQALEHAHLKNFVASLPGQLHYECGEGGHNLSVGQRQLMCLARTLLKQTKILILDEATAAVDLQTDDLIQDTIRNEFQDCTVLSIAHRLHTVLDYDKVMVMDSGLICEFDTPQHLLANPQSVFYGMAKDAGLVSGNTTHNTVDSSSRSDRASKYDDKGKSRGAPENKSQTRSKSETTV